MGFRPPRRIYRLRFEDEDLAGLVVRAHSTKLGVFLDVTGMVGLDPEDGISPEQAGQLGDVFEAFAEALIEWNVEDDEGQPVPATLDGVKGQDADFILRIIRAWMEAISSVPPGSGTTSSGGGRSATHSPPTPPPLPMEPMVPTGPELAEASQAS